jgi:predicted kinase
MADVPGSRLIVICGLPGAGKTTLATRLEQSESAIRFCPDEWMEALSMDVWDSRAKSAIETLQWQVVQRLLQLGATVVIEWGTWTRLERDALREGARALGASVELLYLSAPVEVLFERTQQRRWVHAPITWEQLNQWAEQFEEPTPEELALFDAPRGVV